MEALTFNVQLHASIQKQRQSHALKDTGDVLNDLLVPHTAPVSVGGANAAAAAAGMAAAAAASRG
jgi:hypothetical protein